MENLDVKNTNEEDAKQPIPKYKYIVTLFHHNEDLKYFTEYHLVQINFMKKKIAKENLPIKIQVYIFTSVNLERLEEGEAKVIELNCSHISKYFDDKLNDFKIKIKKKKINEIRYINILPYEYDLMKQLFNFSEENNIKFTELMYGEAKLMDKIDWNNNTIGAKRFVSQSLVINKHIKNYPRKCLGYFHWQIDLYIKIGIPSYAKDCYHDNNVFYELIKQKNNHVLDISNFLYNPPDFRIQNIDDDRSSNNDFNDIGEIIVSTNNSEYYTFMIAHYDVKNKVDHFTLGQIDINGIIGYKPTDKQIACIKGITDIARSPYKPKYKECKLLVHSHYDKFYITNIKTIITTDAYYNPLFTNWSEDIFFTKCLNKRNLIILPFFLFTYTVKKKENNYKLPSYLFSNSTFKAFAGIFSQSEESNEELKINYISDLRSCPTIQSRVKINLAMDKSCSLTNKTRPDVYAKARSDFSLLLGTLTYYYNSEKKCQSIPCKNIPVSVENESEKLENLKNYLTSEKNGIILIPSAEPIHEGRSTRRTSPVLSCYSVPLNIPNIMDRLISNEDFDALLYNNFFRIVKKKIDEDKYIFNIIFSSDFLCKAPSINKKFELYKNYYSWDYDYKRGFRNFRDFTPSTVSGIIKTYMKCVYNYLEKCVTLNSVKLNCQQDCLPCPLVEPKKRTIEEINEEIKEEGEITQNNEKCKTAYNTDNGFEEHEYGLNIVKLPDEAAAEDEVSDKDGTHKKLKYKLKYLKYKMKYLNLKKISMSNKTIY